MSTVDIEKLPRRALMAGPLPRGWCLLAAFTVSLGLWAGIGALALAVH